MREKLESLKFKNIFSYILSSRSLWNPTLISKK